MLFDRVSFDLDGEHMEKAPATTCILIEEGELIPSSLVLSTC